MLVMGIFVSLLYDLFWFMIQDYASEHPEDGGLEKGVRNFSLTMSYLSFFFRVILYKYNIPIDHSGFGILERLT